MKYQSLQEFLQVSHVEKAKKLPAFLDHLFAKINSHIQNKGKILLLTLTKKSSEEITNFLVSQWYKAYYLHSEIGTIERWDIIKKLRTWVIDILVWINLLREGIDIPEVSLIALLDADKEWFLRSKTSLIQIIGRAARNPLGEVVMYADYFTESMTLALWETYRRRHKQQAYNKEYWITPQVALSNIKDLDVVKDDKDRTQDFLLLKLKDTKKLKRMTKQEKDMILSDLKRQLDDAIAVWEFEKAALIRDQIKELTWD